jgi:signal transduction histidine kinase
VVDTGPGIAPGTESGAQASRISQGEVLSGAGLGFGLPFTKSLAAANGATLTVASRLGHGTRVTISFGRERVVPV